VTRGLEEGLLGDVRCVDELVAAFLVAFARVVLHDPPDDAALWMEDSKTGADLLRK
jgi:hypothetical protein